MARDGKWECGQKYECGQKNMSVLSTTVGVECGVLSVECDSAVSGEPPPTTLAHNHLRRRRRRHRRWRFLSLR